MRGLLKAGVVALPFWIRLYRSKQHCPPEEFHTRLEMVAGALTLVRSWFSGRILLLADGAYANESLITPAQGLEIKIVSRIRSDACLHHSRGPGQGPTPFGVYPLAGLRRVETSSVAAPGSRRGSGSPADEELGDGRV